MSISITDIFLTPTTFHTYHVPHLLVFLDLASLIKIPSVDKWFPKWPDHLQNQGNLFPKTLLKIASIYFSSEGGKIGRCTEPYTNSMRTKIFWIMYCFWIQLHIHSRPLPAHPHIPTIYNLSPVGFRRSVFPDQKKVAASPSVFWLVE